MASNATSRADACSTGDLLGHGVMLIIVALISGLLTVASFHAHGKTRRLATGWPVILHACYFVDALLAGVQMTSSCSLTDSLTSAGLFFHALIYPLAAGTCFELFFMIHKYRNANFCLIRFDAGARNIANDRGTIRMMRTIRTLAYLFILASLALIVAGTHPTMFGPVGGNVTIAAKLNLRFPGFLAKEITWLQIVPVALILLILLHLCRQLWNYGTLYSWQITAFRCNKWGLQLFMTLLLTGSFLLPVEAAMWTTDIMYTLWAATLLMSERLILADMATGALLHKGAKQRRSSAPRFFGGRKSTGSNAAGVAKEAADAAAQQMDTLNEERQLSTTRSAQEQATSV